MTPIDLDAIEKAAKESAIGAWRYRVKINDTWRPWDATVVSTNPATWSRPAFWQDVESEPLFPDQSATILALCARIREPAKVKPLEWTELTSPREDDGRCNYALSHTIETLFSK